MKNSNKNTFLGDAKLFYSDFFNSTTWSDVKATNILKGKRDIVRRKECIKNAYKTILDDKKISLAVIDWITTNHSMQTTAELKGISTSELKNKVYYINCTLGHDWTYKEQNIIRYCLFEDMITEKDWEQIEKIQKQINIKKSKEIYEKKPLISNRNMLINIPRRVYNIEVSNEEFIKFINLIRPYFIESRKAVQQEINTKHLNAAGYFNFIMTPGVKLTNVDKDRLEIINKLLDEETKKQYKNEAKIMIDDIEQVKIEEKNRIIKEELSKKEQEDQDNRDYRKKYKEELDKKENLGTKTTKIQYYF